MLLKIAFEGPCLAGKSTLIAKLEKRLSTIGYDVLIIPEFTDVAGGHRNLPEVRPSGDEEARKAALFFIELERRRTEKLSLLENSTSSYDLKIALIDRTLFSCMMLRHHLKDYPGQEALEKAIKTKVALIPDIVMFICIPQNEEEYLRRLSYRQKFKEWESVYRNITPDSFINFISEHISVPVFVICDAEEDESIKRIMGLILSKVRNPEVECPNHVSNQHASPLNSK